MFNLVPYLSVLDNVLLPVGFRDNVKITSRVTYQAKRFDY